VAQRGIGEQAGDLLVKDASGEGVLGADLVEVPEKEAKNIAELR
jgi:hypothetical protein